MKAKYITYLLAVCVLLTVFAAMAQAQGIKARMTQRLPEITDLKNKGVVGENNRGYLEFVGSQRLKEGVVNDENNDRRTIYAMIANQQNVSIELVEKRRAKQLADRAAAGHFIQNQSGAWIKK